MAPRQRILILDDETKVAFFLQESLEALGYDFEVVSVSSADEALLEIDRQEFDLLVTDQHMPGMTGLELVGKVRERHPDTQFILITAYGSEDVLAKARRLGAYRYFTKPFRIDDFVETVLDALKDTNGRSKRPLANGPVDVFTGRLEELRREVGAQCIVAASPDGAIVAQAGILSDLDLEKLLPLAVNEFVASLALTRYLGEAHSGNLTYYEGTGHDVYMASVEDDLFILIVFDRRVQTSRIGIVWLYVRRAIENLRRVRSALPLAVGLD